MHRVAEYATRASAPGDRTKLRHSHSPSRKRPDAGFHHKQDSVQIRVIHRYSLPCPQTVMRFAVRAFSWQIAAAFAKKRVPLAVDPQSRVPTMAVAWTSSTIVQHPCKRQSVLRVEPNDKAKLRRPRSETEKPEKPGSRPP